MADSTDRSNADATVEYVPQQQDHVTPEIKARAEKILAKQASNPENSEFELVAPDDSHESRLNALMERAKQLASEMGDGLDSALSVIENESPTKTFIKNVEEIAGPNHVFTQTGDFQPEPDDVPRPGPASPATPQKPEPPVVDHHKKLQQALEALEKNKPSKPQSPTQTQPQTQTVPQSPATGGRERPPVVIDPPKLPYEEFDYKPGMSEPYATSAPTPPTEPQETHLAGNDVSDRMLRALETLVELSKRKHRDDDEKKKKEEKEEDPGLFSSLFGFTTPGTGLGKLGHAVHGVVKRVGRVVKQHFPKTYDRVFGKGKENKPPKSPSKPSSAPPSPPPSGPPPATTGGAGGGGDGGGSPGGLVESVSVAEEAGASSSALMFAGGVALFSLATFEFGKIVHSFIQHQENEIRRLAERGGGTQAAAVAQLDAERVRRDVQTAGETGGTSQALIDSLNKFEDALRPFEVTLTNISNMVGTGILDALTGMLNLLKPMAEAINTIAAKFGFREEPIETMWDRLKEAEAYTARIPKIPRRP